MNFNYIVDLILNLIFLAYFISVVYFCEKVKTACKCNGLDRYLDDWRFKYMNYANLVFIFLSLIGLIMKMKALCTSGSGSQRGGGHSIFVNYLIITLIIYSLIFLNHYSIFTLLNDMIEDDCNCEEDLRKLIYYFTMGHFSISVIIFFVIVIGLSKLIKVENNPKEMNRFLSKIKDKRSKTNLKKLLNKK